MAYMKRYRIAVLWRGDRERAAGNGFRWEI
jgi:hypothetical protein